MGMVHIIGGGVSGLAAATKLADAHLPVRLYEATAKAGGRARSSHDATLGTFDHGLHLIDAHSPELFAYLTRIKARDTLTEIASPLTFPTAPLADYLALTPLLVRRRGKFAALFAEDNSLRQEWAARLARLVLHTPLDLLSMAAARRALWRTLKHPRQYGKRFIARDSLTASFIAPALAHLEYCGTSLYFNHALKSLDQQDGALRHLVFARQKIVLAEDDIVILALPAQATAKLIPGIETASEHQAITLHYEINHREPTTHHWAPIQAPVDLVRYSENRISLSIRPANAVWHSDPDFLAERLWRWLQKQHRYLRATAMPAYAIWREKQAGPMLSEHAAHSVPALPAQLLLAGDWLDATLPSSLETATASGHRAADAAIKLMGDYPLRHQ